MHECALETHKPSCAPRAAKPFFILEVHSPLRRVGHVAAPELCARGSRAQSQGTHGSTGAHLNREVRSKAEGHMVAS
jgi:hypothetical protein